MFVKLLDYVMTPMRYLELKGCSHLILKLGIMFPVSQLCQNIHCGSLDIRIVAVKNLHVSHNLTGCMIRKWLT